MPPCPTRPCISGSRLRLQELANTSDYDDLYAPTVYLFKKSLVAANPKPPELLIKAHAEAIKRFYEDKPFALHSSRTPAATLQS
jgi:hypothetical protein